MDAPVEDEDVSGLITEIITGKRVMPVGDQELVFRMPRQEDKLRASFLVESKKREAISRGVPTRKEVIKTMSEMDIVGAEMLSNKQNALEIEKRKINTILKMSGSPRQKEENMRKLDRVERELQSLKSDLLKPLTLCAEAISESYRTIYLMLVGVYTLNEELYWKSLQEFSRDNSPITPVIVNSYIHFAEGLSSTQLRKIARSVQWKLFWRAATNAHTPLFEGAASNWDINKILIVYWSNFYDNLVNYPQPPSEQIINDDHLLDRWLDDQHLMMANNSRTTLSTSKDGKRTKTIHVNEPYTLVTESELKLLEKDALDAGKH